jgi:magnesium-transporting ATPase (P-type)
MAGASLFLSFLPLLPKQILLTNLLTDIPEMTIAGDRVDEELIDRPRRWNIAFIRKFMLTFGLVSSIFDYITFGLLLLFLQAGVEEFRTGWFVESVISASVIVLVVRSRRPFTQSRPSRGLLVATLAVVGLTLLLPYTPLRGPLGFVPLPPLFLAALLCIVVGLSLRLRWRRKSFTGVLSIDEGRCCYRLSMVRTCGTTGAHSPQDSRARHARLAGKTRHSESGLARRACRELSQAEMERGDYYERVRPTIALSGK